MIQQFEPHGAVPNKVGIIMPQDPEQQFSVANQDTPYVIAVFDLKDTGPMVIEVPEGPYIGLIDDHNMEWFGDMGTIGSGKGKGEKNLLVPPGYEGEIPDGYTPLYSKTWKSVLAMRVVVQTGDYDEAVKLARKLKVYPLGQSGDEIELRNRRRAGQTRRRCRCCHGKRPWTTGGSCTRSSTTRPLRTTPVHAGHARCRRYTQGRAVSSRTRRWRPC